MLANRARLGTIRVAVLGATGLTGRELLRLLFAHPNVDIVFASSESSAGSSLAAAVPSLRREPAAKGLRLQELADLTSVDVVFSCLPNGLLPENLAVVEARAGRIINLASDYRLRDRGDLDNDYPASVASAWPDADTYFVPELCSETPSTKLVSLPSGTAWATLLALHPLVRRQLVDVDVLTDARTAAPVSERPNDRHRSEIVDVLERMTGTRLDMRFSALRLDSPRDIVVTTYSKLKPWVTPLDVERAYQQAYANSELVRHRAGRRALPADVATTIEGRNCVTVATLDDRAQATAALALQAFDRLVGGTERCIPRLRWVEETT